MTSAAELERLGLVAAPEMSRSRSRPLPARATGGNRKWPSYARCAGRRAAQQRGDRPRHQPGGFRVVHDGDHLGLGASTRPPSG